MESKFFGCAMLQTHIHILESGEVYVGRPPNANAINLGANSPTELVMRLAGPWLNAGRNITVDNHFTSLPLAECLLAQRTTYVGTIRKNKRDIPSVLFLTRRMRVESSVFCFDRQFTLVSYILKVNKAVILLSTMHHDKNINQTNHNKPEIIEYYNQTKSGVDNLDHLTRIYSCNVKRDVGR